MACQPQGRRSRQALTLPSLWARGPPRRTVQLQAAPGIRCFGKQPKRHAISYRVAMSYTVPRTRTVAEGGWRERTTACKWLWCNELHHELPCAHRSRCWRPRLPSAWSTAASWSTRSSEFPCKNACRPTWMASSVADMAYESVDKLQKTLARTVFTYAKDRKKAAGRALGTLVEIITFYLLKTWGLGASVAIERGLEEYKNPDIKHNVEYSLHPVKFVERQQLTRPKLPITPAKIFKTFGDRLQHLQGFERKKHALLSSSGVLRNACVLAEQERRGVGGPCHSTERELPRTGPGRAISFARTPCLSASASGLRKATRRARRR